QLGRLGGEEFAVLLPETDIDAAMALAQRILSSVENAAIDELIGRKCTISAGVAEAGPADQSLAPVLERADKALYRAKSNGRNRVVPASMDDHSGAHFLHGTR
ncbi:MAG: GGDEF domain-containing protein, partial [Verrucomicrobiaceae bacterium]